ncbi:MAG: methyltransferase domain-containing protein [Actinobacteria bacterium]|nr:methyltransferase domain-containing protein [Actinomycetota bacterium]
MMPVSPHKAQSGEIALRDEQAAGYAADYRRTKGGWWDDLERHLLLRGVCARPGMRVLDAGCGTGRLAFALARAGCQVEAVDLSSESIRILRGSEPALQHMIGARVHDLTEPLPLPDGSMDGVVSCQVVQHIPTREARVAAWRNMAQVAKEGARVATIVYHLNRGSQREGQFSERLFYHRYTRDDLSAELSQAGWNPIEMSVWYHRSWKCWNPALATCLERLLSMWHGVDCRGVYLSAVACRS